jgi:hypothetical protein
MLGTEILKGKRDIHFADVAHISKVTWKCVQKMFLFLSAYIVGMQFHSNGLDNIRFSSNSFLNI